MIIRAGGRSAANPTIKLLFLGQCEAEGFIKLYTSFVSIHIFSQNWHISFIF